MRRALLLGLIYSILIPELVQSADSSAAPATTNPLAQATPLGGYLAPEEVPSSAALVLSPPAPGSSAMARDEEANRSALALHDGPRWRVATQDAVLAFPAVAETFACALGTSLSEARTPRLMTLLRRTLVDAGRSTGEAKRLHKRARPFTVNNQPICTPEMANALRADGSFPSGHAAIGWAFGLVLSEVAPEQANAVLARGRAFGQSRLVCNVHWQSDVLEGQMVASAVVARLHADPEFRADMEAARAEFASLRAAPIAPARSCEAESQALATWR